MLGVLSPVSFSLGISQAVDFPARIDFSPLGVETVINVSKIVFTDPANTIVEGVSLFTSYVRIFSSAFLRSGETVVTFTRFNPFCRVKPC